MHNETKKRVNPATAINDVLSIDYSLSCWLLLHVRNQPNTQMITPETSTSKAVALGIVSLFTTTPTRPIPMALTPIFRASSAIAEILSFDANFQNNLLPILEISGLDNRLNQEIKNFFIEHPPEKGDALPLGAETPPRV